MWDVDTGTCLRMVDKRVRAIGICDDGTRMLSADRDGITTWSVETGERIGGLDGRFRLGTADPVFDRAGRLALVAESGGAIRLWNLVTGECEQELAGHASEVLTLWLGPELAVSAGLDRAVRLWSLRTGQCLRTLRGHTDCVSSVCLSPDGRRILSSGRGTDRTIRLWDAATGECVRVFGHQPDNLPGAFLSRISTPYKRIRFSPDGRFAFSAASDATVRIWDLATGRCLRVMDDHEGPVALAVSPDGRFLLTADGWFSDGTIRRWELDWDLRIS